jgi:rhodanese-related sulfurtransferase
MREISAENAAAHLAADPDNTVLLDVRELPELQLASVEGALHIPMGEIPDRLDEIDAAKTIICMCHSGGRSAQVAAFFAAQGYEQAINLVGGITAWSQDVDTSIPQY